MEVERGMKLLRVRDSAELGKVASGAAMKTLWLGDRKVTYQIIGEN